ncbi:Tetratricopeptide repeat protein 33 [Camellia lanceoleosa]|uniref:Tetratricopeptide repeat protein 33 n=1 Tax=Camellia lanceoleosa TaxID=1840588 RepID=A0ACC0HPC8_9ERIC|nr:Tetratricopeptide repeat protein 33 [Camellia lanceoleosa]
MKLTWKNQNKKHKRPLLSISTLPFDQSDDHITNNSEDRPRSDNDTDHNTEQAQTYHHNDTELAEAFHAQGNKLAEDGRYHEALGKWEAAITLMPERAVLHEQKAQVLLEIGEAWNALKAAIRATELEPSWAEAWITLGRAQLNFGEPDNAIESFDRALAIKPDFVEALDDRETASHLVKKRKQLHSSGSSTTKNRYVVGDKTESS